MKLNYLIAPVLFSMSAIAFAAPGLGNADVSDFTLNGASANGIAFSKANGQAGPDGNSAVFDTVFTGDWNLLAKVNSASQFSSVADIPGTALGLSFSLAPDQKSGVWSITSSQNLVLDLVLGMHAGGATTSFLFDNAHLTAGQTETGTFKIDWFNGSGKNVPDFSNLTLFYKDAAVTPSVSPVPEPATYAMMLGGLGLFGLIATRRRKTPAAQACA